MGQRMIRKLDDLMDGGVTERFEAELQKVLKNIYDPNTKPSAVRSITLTFAIQPNERRDAANWDAKVSSKLAPPIPITQTVFLAQRDDGSIVATEITNQVAGQMNMDGEAVLPKVVEFGTKRSERGMEQ